MKQAGMRVDTWGYEIISNQDYLVGKCTHTQCLIAFI